MANQFRNSKLFEKRNPLKLKVSLVAITIILLSLALVNNFFAQNSVNIISFAIIHFLGYLFFLLLPVEGLFFYYLTQDHNFFVLILVALATALLSQTADYILGLLASENVKNMIKPQRYERYKNYLSAHGRIVIFLFNLSIFSSPIVILVSGILRINYLRVMFYSFLGLLFKYVIITIIYFMLM